MLGKRTWEREESVPHPRREPRLEGALTLERLREVFADCADFGTRELCLWDRPELKVTLCYLVGMARNERLNDYILRPMATDPALMGTDIRGAYRRLRDGGIYNMMVLERRDLDSAVLDLINGSGILFFHGVDGAVLSCMTVTEEKRAVSAPVNEPSAKGARDSFVESLRTNTSLVRRRLRAPELRIREQIVGRQTLTPVDLLWIDGIADPETVARAEEQLAAIDIDGVLSTGNVEEYLTGQTATPFPLLAYTERPDRFADGLVEGRVGLLIDGIPLGYLLPGTVSQFLRASQDKSANWMAASTVLVLRYLCLLVTLFLPAFYVAVVTYQPGILPTRLALSIIAAKQEVPFSTIVEVLAMLVAFEILQEAGLRLPASIGQTVSILGGLVVGSAAVEAKIVSPAVLIAVAVAGIAGYTMPSQDFAAALRLWRFLLVVAGGIAGLLGVVLGGAALVYHLARLESFGVPYLSPFAAADGAHPVLSAALRLPLPRHKLRPRLLRTPNRRNQR